MKATHGLASRATLVLAVISTLAVTSTACSGGGGDGAPPPPATQSSVTVVATGGGIVTSPSAALLCGHGGACAASVNDGTVVSMTASADPGWLFTGWGGACSGTGTCAFTLTADTSVTATFVPLRLVTVTVTGGGTVTSTPAGLSCTAGACSAAFAAGTTVTLAAVTPGGWTFSGWNGDCFGVGACGVTLSGSAAVASTFAPTSGTAVTFQGRVTYDFVPATYNPASRSGSLDFGATEERPVRGAVVRVMNGSTVLATGATNENGDYVLAFEPGSATQVTLLALARTWTPGIQVEDNTDGNAVWSVAVDTTPTSGPRNLRATHGWNGTTYVAANRIAAPFAILDSMYTAARRFLDLPRAVPFPALKVNWSPDNLPEGGDKALGQITTSHYSPSEGEIYILGKEGVDTDEFDSHVIVHEWGHYFEDNLSRSDSPGGPHGGGDVLDPRLAFGEGYGNAIAAMLLPESIYADTLWSGASIVAFGFDAETVPNPTDDFSTGPLAGMNPGPFSEMSVLRILYDLHDPANDDGVALGLGPICDTLVGPQKTTDALTTIGSFVAGLKSQPGVNATAVDALLGAFGIGPISDQWGTGDADLRGMFTDVTALPFSGGVTLGGGADTFNKWQSVQYWVVTGTGGQLTVSSFSTSDVGIAAYRLGNRVAFADSLLGNQTETMRFGSVNGAKYVIVLIGFEVDPISYTASLSVTSP